MENTTKDKIFYTSFRLFLENGYEATNIRDICKEVGIKASTLYFYYKSKQDLFFCIYDDICNEYVKYIKSIDMFKADTKLKEKLYILLKQKLEYYISDISKHKFILRYHLFPPEELSKAIREKYKFYAMEERKILLDIIGQDSSYNEFINKNIEDHLLEYKRLEEHLLYEMIITSIKIKEEVIEDVWTSFWVNVNR